VLELQESDDYGLDTEEEAEDSAAKQVNLEQFSLRRTRLYRRRWIVLLLLSLSAMAGSASSGSLLAGPGSAAGDRAEEAYFPFQTHPIQMSVFLQGSMALMSIPAAITVINKQFRLLIIII
jgi:hypothetical protein